MSRKAAPTPMPAMPEMPPLPSGGGAYLLIDGALIITENDVLEEAPDADPALPAEEA